MGLPAQAPVLPGGFVAAAKSQVSPRIFVVGGNPALNAADGTDSTPVVTEIYMGELLVSHPTTVQGLAVFSGSVWSDNFKLGLFDNTGKLLAATASTAGNATADTYQRAALAYEFISTGAAVAATQIQLASGTYYIGIILDGTTSRLNTHTKGNFGAGKITGAVYSTAFSTTSLQVTPPQTFTTNLAPFAGLY